MRGGCTNLVLAAGYGENRGSIAAFLFTWPDGDTSQPVIKLQKVGGAGLATIDMPETVQA